WTTLKTGASVEHSHGAGDAGAGPAAVAVSGGPATPGAVPGSPGEVVAAEAPRTSSTAPAGAAGVEAAAGQGSPSTAPVAPGSAEEAVSPLELTVEPAVTVLEDGKVLGRTPLSIQM